MWIEIIDRFSLPKEKGHYWFATKNGKVVQNYFNTSSKEDGYKQHFLNFYTHFQKVEKPTLPNYERLN